MTTFETIHHNEVGALARRNQTTVKKTESAGGRNASGPVDGNRLHAACNRRADKIIEVALIGNIERIPVICAQCQKLRVALGNDRHKRFQILGN